MDRRNFPNSFRMVVDQGPDRNHLNAEQSYIHTGRIVLPENGSSVYPMGNTLSNSAPQWNSESRVNEYPSSSFSMEAPPFQPTFYRSSYGLPQSSAAGNLHIAPESNAGRAHPNYFTRSNRHDNEHGQLNSITVSEMRPLKRKSPAFSEACERGITSRFYGAGSSSSSSESLQGKPSFSHPNTHFGHTSLPHYGSGSLSIAGEGPSRNVRSRSRLDLGPMPLQTQLSSYSSHHHHSTTHPSNYHGAVDLTIMNAGGTTRQWNFHNPPPAAHGRIQTSGTTGLSHESNQLFVRGSGTGIGGTGIGGLPSDSTSSRNLVSSSQYFPTPPIQGAREVRASHSHRAIPTYRAGLRYFQLGHESASSDNDLQALSETYSSRYPRLSARGWRNSQRSGRSRIAVERFQLISSVVDAHDRIGSEDIMMMDHSSFYADSRNLFDQYRDMRLDIDNMSYEELLALGERIGDVSTGISEDVVSKCVTKTMYYSHQNHKEGSCAICLEAYASEEEVGTMKNCGHNYHACCIKKWLLMKNVCPICKAPALKDSKQE